MYRIGAWGFFYACWVLVAATATSTPERPPSLKSKECYTSGITYNTVLVWSVGTARSLQYLCRKSSMECHAFIQFLILHLPLQKVANCTATKIVETWTSEDQLVNSKNSLDVMFGHNFVGI